MKNKKVYGLLLMVIAMFMLITIWSGDQLGSIKTIIWTIIFGFFLIRGIIKSVWFSTALAAYFLIVMYNQIYRFLPFPPEPLFIILMIFFLGFSLFFGKKRIYSHSKIIVNKSDEGIVNTTFSSETKYINDKKIENFKLRVLLSESKLYFDNADLKYDNASFDIVVKLASVVLYVPKDWEIVNELEVTMGEVKQSYSNILSTKKVYLRGKVTMGALEIVYI